MSLSRRQLAAALLEYDNNSSSPTRPKVDHRSSAIFRQFIQPERPPSIPYPNDLPSSSRHDPARRFTTMSPGVSVSVTSQSPRNDPNVLNDPSSHVETPPTGDLRRDESEMELSRWDLPPHLLSSSNVPPPQTAGPSSNSKLTSTPPSFPSIQITANSPPSPPKHSDLPPIRTRSAYFAKRPELQTSPVGRARSIHLDLAEPGTGIMEVLGNAGGKDSVEGDDEIQGVLDRAERIRRIAGGEALDGSGVETLSQPRGVGESRRSISFSDQHPRDAIPGHHRRISNPMMVPLPSSPGGSQRPLSSLSQSLSAMDFPHEEDNSMEYQDDEEEEDQQPNPFALPPPPNQLSSRFDPKVLQAQRRNSFDDAQPIAAVRPVSRQSLSHNAYQQPSSWSDPRLSQYSDLPKDISSLPGSVEQDPPSKVYPDIPTPEEFGKPLKPNKYGPNPWTRAVLRPKNLIMPAPLAGQSPPRIKSTPVPEGWTLGERPLPPGSRTSILTMSPSGGGRPGLPMSLSQKTFRSSLMVGGERGDGWIGGAEEEGEVGVGEEALARFEKRPGKLYGKSLMDQLEARKAELKSKQRVFTGDSRPAMMARSSDRPISQIDPHVTSPTNHRNSTGGGVMGKPTVPLLQFDNDGQIIPNPEATSPQKSATVQTLAGNRNSMVVPEIGQGRMSKSKSVFGVDQIWEKEMAKLKSMEEKAAKEKAEREESERRKLEEMEMKRKKKDKGKRKSKGAGEARPLSGTSAFQEVSPENNDLALRVPGEVISPIRKSTELPPMLSYSPDRPTVPVAPLEETLQDQPRRPASRLDLDDWISSDEEGGNSQMRRKNKVKAADNGKGKAKVLDEDESSDEDVPLSRLAPPKPKVQVPGDSDSEEDVPLSKLAKSPLSVGVSPPSLNIALPQSSGSLGLSIQPVDSGDHEDDDDVPLMARKSQQQGHSPSRVEEIEDDLPLGYKHAEAAQRQAAQFHTGASGNDWWTSRASVMPSFQSPYAPAGPMWPTNPYGMGMGMGMGMPSMPNMNMSMNMGMQPSMSVYGMPDPMAAMAMIAGHQQHQQEENIDKWRRDVRPPSVATGSRPSSTR